MVFADGRPGHTDVVSNIGFLFAFEVKTFCGRCYEHLLVDVLQQVGETDAVEQVGLLALAAAALGLVVWGALALGEVEDFAGVILFIFLSSENIDLVLVKW